MIPGAAELVIGDHDQGVAGLWPGFDCLDQVDEVITAVRFAGITRMLVLVAKRLDEADLRQGPVLGRGDELDLVLQVRVPIGGAGGIAREVVEGLMVELEARVRAERILRRSAVDVRPCRRFCSSRSRPASSGPVAVRVVPAAGIPRPADGRRSSDRRC